MLLSGVPDNDDAPAPGWTAPDPGRRDRRYLPAHGAPAPRHIYRKLNVPGRLTAVLRAKALGLVPGPPRVMWVSGPADPGTPNAA